MRRVVTGDASGSWFGRRLYRWISDVRLARSMTLLALHPGEIRRMLKGHEASWSVEGKDVTRNAFAILTFALGL